MRRRLPVNPRSERLRPRPRSHRPLFEVMESRSLLSTTPILVTSTADNVTGGTLRAAIVQANATAGPAVIAFAIPGPGVHTISLATDLPAITHPVTIDATTQ